MLFFDKGRSNALVPLKLNEDGETITAMINDNDFDCAITAMEEEFGAVSIKRQEELAGKPCTMKHVTFRANDRPFFTHMLGMIVRNQDIGQFVATIQA